MASFASSFFGFGGITLLCCASVEGTYWLKDRIKNDSVVLTTENLNYLYEEEARGFHLSFLGRLEDFNKYNLITKDQVLKINEIKKSYFDKRNAKNKLVRQFPKIDFKAEKQDVNQDVHEKYKILETELERLEEKWKIMQAEIRDNLDGIPGLLVPDFN